MMRRYLWGLVLMSIMSVVGVVRADKLEDTVKELVETHKNLESYSASVKSHEKLKFENGNELDSTVTGKVQWMRKGEKLYYRADSESRSVQKVKELSTPMHAEQTMILDGEYFYTLANVMGEVHAAKQNPNPMLNANAQMILDELKADYKLTLDREETWSGTPCYVFEAIPKDSEANEHMARAFYYFSKETGMAIRTLGYNAKGEIAYSIEHFDSQRNPKLDPEKFKFTLPEGVRLDDYVNP